MGKLCIPHGLSQQEVSQLDQYVSHSTLLKAGDFLYKQNDTFKSLYAVKSGSVKIIAQSHDGQKNIIGIFLPGEIIGFDGLASGNYQYSTLAIEICHVCEIGIDSVHSTIPSMHLQLLKHACKAAHYSQLSYSRKSKR